MPFLPCALLVIALLPAIAAAQCAPATLGPPCQQAGLTLAAQPDVTLNLGAGNPIHLASGNKYQRESDLPANPGLRGLEILRHYNAMDPREGALGRGWQFSYDTRLYRRAGSWQIVQADGTRLRFPDAGRDDQGRYPGPQGTLAPQGDAWHWLWADGSRLQFDARGLLMALEWPNGTRVQLQRHAAGTRAGLLDRVTNDRGQALHFHYRDTGAGRPRVTAIDTPLGRFRYVYDDSRHARLQEIIRPDGMARRYAHDATAQAGHPHALTGIAIRDARGRAVSVATWVYDSRGRAIAWHAGPASEIAFPAHLQIDYRRSPDAGRDGLTVVRDEHGRETAFHIGQRGGRYVLLRSDGQACPGCSVPGLRARHDARGRLRALETPATRLRFERDPQGRTRSLRVQGTGWPGLRIDTDAQGRMLAWHSTATGTQRIRRDADGLPRARHLANGDSVRLRFDAQRRPIQRTESGPGGERITRLAWHGHSLQRIDHPEETQELHRDARGRLRRREILRAGRPDAPERRWVDRFTYDAQNRLRTHHLPEGGRLDYRYDGARLTAIDWTRGDGHRTTVWEIPADASPALQAWRWANGVRLRGSHRALRLQRGAALLWGQDIETDALGRVVAERFHRAEGPGPASDEHWYYAYDAQHRLAGARSAGDGTQWYAWADEGSAAAQRRHGNTHRPDWQRDAAGLPQRRDADTITWNAAQRPATVSRHGRRVLRQIFDAFGYRIAREDALGRRTDYLYLNRQLVGEVAAHSRRSLDRRYIHAGLVPVAFIDYSDARPHGALFAIHTDHLGAPRLVTDEHAQVRWSARYSPLGEATITGGDLRLELRLPGQYHEPATGWHDNLLRSYDPRWGQYLEPDPLGPLPGTQAWGYAAQQPRRHIDPLGLLLFAFDGTRQSADTAANVWKLAQVYQDGPAHYHPGPGNSLYMDWNALTAQDARQIIDTQWKWLLLELSRAAPDTVTPVDIIGFSRGAALARHFGNLIGQYMDGGLFRIEDTVHGAISACVDLRFMGLFDTVAQFGVGGVQNRNYDLTIDPAWQWVAHAVALHERRWLFPLTTAADAGAGHVVEAPLVGAHGDIGGGRTDDGGDLADVALNWLRWQAQAAAVRLGPLPSAEQQVDSPILHDLRSSLARQVQDGDRSVLSSANAPLYSYQQDHPRLGAGPRAQTETFITRLPGREGASGDVAGQVDMDAYGQWLREELGWPEPPV